MLLAVSALMGGAIPVRRGFAANFVFWVVAMVCVIPAVHHMREHDAANTVWQPVLLVSASCQTPALTSNTGWRSHAITGAHEGSNTQFRAEALRHGRFHLSSGGSVYDATPRENKN